jgi:hypothetical protein
MLIIEISFLNKNYIKNLVYFLCVYPSLCKVRHSVEILRLLPIQSSISDWSSYKYQSTLSLSRTSRYFRSLELKIRDQPNRGSLSTRLYFLKYWHTRSTADLLIPRFLAIYRVVKPSKVFSVICHLICNETIDFDIIA